MSQPDFNTWATHLRHIAEQSLSPLHANEPFTDDLGHRRPVDIPFFTWRHNTPSTKPTHAVLPTDAIASPDVMLWRTLADQACIDIFAPPLNISPSPSPPAPITPGHDSGAIEVWTETELSALHALRWIATQHADDTILARVHAAARWHLLHTQPDNATNHPWAIHVFIELSILESNAHARLYAETLLHNCQVSQGHPDTFSAHILADATDALELMGA